VLTAFATGFATSISLILAIGAQNAFMLRQGLRREHVFELALLFALSDAVLIAAGIVGFDIATERFPLLPQYLSWLGAAFLVIYGGLRFRAAWTGSGGMVAAGATAPLGTTLAVGAAFTWLNPHVYLDTLGLIGAISTGFQGVQPKVAFAFGAIGASFVFFFSLGYGARFLAPLMGSDRAWRVLDAGIGLTMWALAALLLARPAA